MYPALTLLNLYQDYRSSKIRECTNGLSVLHLATFVIKQSRTPFTMRGYQVKVDEVSHLTITRMCKRILQGLGHPID